MKSDETREGVLFWFTAGTCERATPDLMAHEAQLLEDHHCLTQEQAQAIVQALTSQKLRIFHEDWFRDWMDRAEKGAKGSMESPTDCAGIPKTEEGENS